MLLPLSCFTRCTRVSLLARGCRLSEHLAGGVAGQLPSAAVPAAPWRRHQHAHRQHEGLGPGCAGRQHGDCATPPSMEVLNHQCWEVKEQYIQHCRIVMRVCHLACQYSSLCSKPNKLLDNVVVVCQHSQVQGSHAAFATLSANYIIQ